MSVQLAMLVATAVLAVVALAAAVVALRALREAKQLSTPPDGTFVTERPAAEASGGHDVTKVELVARDRDPEPDPEPERTAEVVRVVEGRVIVQPTQDQVVAASMTRPAVRLNIVAAGLAHALRPESRDRITGLMRREYRARKRARQRAARAAARATNDPPPASGRGWVGS